MRASAPTTWLVALSKADIQVDPYERTGSLPLPRRGGCPHPPVVPISARGGQRQRKEKLVNAMTTPTRSAPSATGRQHRLRRRPKRARRPGKIGAGTDPPTPVARRAPLHRSAPKRPFLLDRARPVFFSAKTEKKMGGASRWTSPLREQTPPAIGQKTRHRRIRSNSSGTAPPPRAEWAHFQLYFPQFYILSRAGTIWNSFSDNYRPSPRWRS